MSARTRSISAADCAALVEKPPTSTSISVTPSFRLEKRVPSSAESPYSDEYFFSTSELVDRDDAGRRAGQQLLDLAAQVAVKRRGPPGGGNRQQERDHPQRLAVPHRPGDETTGEGSWRVC